MGRAPAELLEQKPHLTPGPADREPVALTYVVPWLASEPAGREAVSYLREVSQWCAEVIVVDGSRPEVFAVNARAWGSFARHVVPDPGHRCLMGKVAGVLTGIGLARHEHVVLADDDVRYTRPALERVNELLGRFDLVRPQNYFDPLPWHAAWDSARSLLNRSVGADFPGTLGVRRDFLSRTGGYDGDVMFENLELIRTVEASGGRSTAPLDLYVRRLPPTAAHFWAQRTRQAYDDFAIPWRMALWLGVLPGLAGLRASRRWGPGGAAALSLVGLAECGRRRGGGRQVFSVVSTVLAPGWVLERGVCAWLAVFERLRFGGVRYGDSVIPVAAHSKRELRRRHGSRPTSGPSLAGSAAV